MEHEALIRAIESQRNMFMNENLRLQIIIEQQAKIIQELQQKAADTTE